MIFAGLVAFTAAAAPRVHGAAPDRPLIGVNYSHYLISGCDQGGTGIIAYGAPDGLVRQQLAAMRAAGLETLRLILWHMHDASNQDWGVVSSAGGRLQGDARANLVSYLRAARSLGYQRLTVSFAPMWTNDPIGYPQNVYDPTLFDENWGVIRDVRAVVKANGPRETRFDLLNEGSPSDYLATRAQVHDYLREMYTRYVDAFGNDDVTVSSIAINPGDWTRLPNLLRALRASGRPLPTWFEIHPAYEGDLAMEDLRATDATLAAEGLSQPIAIGETAYNAKAVADTIKRFADASPRKVLEVAEWPLAASRPCANFSVSPPYRADAYVTTLAGSAPPRTFSAAVQSGRISLRTAYGEPLIALRAGMYELTVGDHSRLDNFHLTGPGANRKTGRRFRGSTTWSLRLREGTYRFRSDRPRSRGRGAFAVLAGG